MLHSKDLSFNSGWSFSACLVKQRNQTLCICKYLEFCSTNKKFTKFLYCSPFNCPSFKLCLPPPWLNICQSPACKISYCASIALIPPLSPILCAFLSSFYKDSCFSTFFKIRQHCFFCQRLFDSTNACWCSSFYLKLPFSFMRSYKTADISENHSVNLWFHPTIPRNGLRASFDSGGSASSKAFTLSELGFRPSWVKTYIKNSTLFFARWHFFGDSVSPFSLSLCNTFDNVLIMFLNVFPPLRMSSL